jgi:acylglycerol lipase
MAVPKRAGSGTSQVHGDIAGAKATRIHWQAWLPDGSALGVVVLAHGGLEHGGRYGHLGRRLAAEGLATYAVDFRGHGRSAGRRGQIGRFELLVDDLSAAVTLARERHPRLPVFLIGHSLGAMVALQYVVRGDRDLAGMVLSGTGIDVSAIPRSQAILAKALSVLTPNLGLMKLDAVGVSRDPEVVRQYDSDPLVFRGRVPVRTAAELLASASRVTPRLAAARLPVLVMHGGDDVLAAPAGARLVHDRVKSLDKTLIVFPGMYHEIFNEPEKEKVIARLIEWLTVRL